MIIFHVVKNINPSWVTKLLPLIKIRLENWSRRTHFGKLWRGNFLCNFLKQTTYVRTFYSCILNEAKNVVWILNLQWKLITSIIYEKLNVVIISHVCLYIFIAQLFTVMHRQGTNCLYTFRFDLSLLW